MSFKADTLHPPSPATTRGLSTKISVDPKGERLIYTNGRNVIFRDLKNPALAWSYSGHVKEATVARISPSGYYCASGDVTGLVKIWDIVGEDRILKNEVKVISGRINDLAWDSESKRIIAVGEGRERFGHAFTFDSGNSVGEISGHSKYLNAVSIRYNRPFKAVTAGEDRQVGFFNGPPFKYDHMQNEHTNSVHAVAYSPNGDHFASGGADRKINLYDGKEGKHLATLEGHNGGVFAVSWSKDSKEFASSSGDGSVRVWDVASSKVVETWDFAALASTPAEKVNHQQVGNVWATENEIVSVSLSGDLSVIDRRSGGKPARVLHGPQKAITSFSYSPSTKTLFAGSFDGRVVSYSGDSGECKPVNGQGHGTIVNGLATSGGNAYSIGWDDSVREIDGKQSVFTPTVASLTGQPKGVAADAQGSVFIATEGDVQIIKDGKKIFSLPVNFQASAIAASSKGLVAVGGQDKKIYVYKTTGSTLDLVETISESRQPISALSFSPDGSLLAAGESNGKILLFDPQTKEVKTSSWSGHTARIDSIAWSPSGSHAASASLDTHVFVWSVAQPDKKIPIRNAHPDGATGVAWISDGDLVSSGRDAGVRRWKITV